MADDQFSPVVVWLGLCFVDARGANSTDRYFHGHRTLQLHQSLEISVSLGQIRTFDFHIRFAAFNFENTDARGDLENICEPKKLKQSDKQHTLKVSTDLCLVSGWMHVEHWQFSLIVRSSLLESLLKVLSLEAYLRKNGPLQIQVR